MIEMDAVITKLQTNKDGTQVTMDVLPKSLDAIKAMLDQTVAVTIDIKQAGLFDENGEAAPPKAPEAANE